MRTLLLVLLPLLAAPLPLRAADKPNILIILADDLGYGDVRCYNDQAKVATPHIDLLAKDGMRLPRSAWTTRLVAVGP